MAGLNFRRRLPIAVQESNNRDISNTGARPPADRAVCPSAIRKETRYAGRSCLSVWRGQWPRCRPGDGKEEALQHGKVEPFVLEGEGQVALRAWPGVRDGGCTDAIPLLNDPVPSADGG